MGLMAVPPGSRQRPSPLNELVLEGGIAAKSPPLPLLALSSLCSSYPCPGHPIVRAAPHKTSLGLRWAWFRFCSSYYPP